MMVLMAKAVFLEGTDGGGKSTQISLLKEYLESKGEKVVAIREPGGSDYFEALRALHFDDKLQRPPMSDTLLTAAGRAANIELSRQALADGAWLITDRAYPSSFAYQNAQGVPWEAIREINNLAIGDFNYDIKIVIDVPVVVARKRVEGTGAKKDHWESRGDEFFEQIRANYLRLAEEEGHIVINGEKSVEELHKLIVEAIGL
jgi:dTMP kinase